VVLFLAVLLAAPLGGCGFRPLYGKTSFDPNIQDELASIRVLPLQDRQGQLLRNALMYGLSPKGEPEHARYRLRILIAVNETQQALRTDDTATRDTVSYDIRYFLYEGDTAVTAGALNRMFSYDFLEEHFANVAAAEDIHKRAASTIADDIRVRLAAYFAKNAETKATSGDAH
jgi:LPS-assembly lipoprotein